MSGNGAGGPAGDEGRDQARDEQRDQTQDQAAYRATGGDRIVPPHPSQIDLHTHTRRSDGILEPWALVQATRAAGVRMLAITDHDTLAGFRELPADDAFEIVLPGVEINSVAAGVEALWEGELHILGLGVDPDDEAFEATLATQRQRRVERFFRIVTRLRSLGLPIDAQVDGLRPEEGAALGRPHLARFLVAAGHATSVDDAMRRLLARGRPAYEPRVGLGPADAIAAIRRAGGLPVLAHFSEAGERFDLVRELRDAGLGGLEVHYRHFSAATVTALTAVARELRLVPTGGSDYHGDLETYAEAHASLYVPDALAPVIHDALVAADAARGVAP